MIHVGRFASPSAGSLSLLEAALFRVSMPNKRISSAKCPIIRASLGRASPETLRQRHDIGESMKQHLKGEVTSEGIAAHTDPFLEIVGEFFRRLLTEEP